jgi:hypothetical protein
MKNRQHHLLVAGTGRAGTSALVRYLTGLGLETHLSRCGDAAQWDEAAQAGLEDIPLSRVARDLPYVVKSPWSYEFVEEILEDPGIQLDGVIVPVRDLLEASASRITRQLQAMHQELPWMAQTATFEHCGITPGGVIFSLNPVDEARLLAVGFHRLLERLVDADIPIVLLAFPRLAADPDYLHRRLAPLLPTDIPIAQARAVHAETFRIENVRIGRELGSGTAITSVVRGGPGASFLALDNAALKRELTHLRDRLGEAAAQHDTLARERDALHDRLADEMSRLRNQLDETDKERSCLAQARDTLRDLLEGQVARTAKSEASRTVLEGERDLLREQLQRAHCDNAALAQELLALQASRSWRSTRPLRALGSALRTGLHQRPARGQPGPA